jgi:hypothetical protein
MIYKQVALEMAKLLLADARSQTPEQDVTDLLDCFLMDVASIAGTNDKRLTGASPFGASVRADIAKVYEHYKKEMKDSLPYGYKHLDPLFPPEKTPSAVTAAFVKLGKAVMAAATTEK